MAKQKEYPVNKPMYNPAHPGEVLKEILTTGLKLKIGDAAVMLDVDRTTLSRLLNGHISVSVDMAMRIAKALDGRPEFWLKLQHQYDLAPARRRSVDLSRVRRFPVNEQHAPA